METQNSDDLSPDPQQAIRFGSWILALGLLMTGIGAAFLPWIWREGVALQLTGPGLAEFVKFLPDVRTMQVKVERLFFLLPLFLAMLALPIFAENKGLVLPPWLRWIMRLTTIPLTLASLSPVWTPPILLAPEFRLQTGLATIAIGLAIIAPLFKHLPLKVLVILLIGGGLAAIVFPMRQFSLIQSAMVETYREPISLSWGWWLTVGGIILSIGGGMYRAFIEPRRQSKNDGEL